jgi:tetratricopeptide (TPR) repeat protein
LAIELAAARCKLFSPQMIHERLGNRLDTLVGGSRDLPVRLQTLRGTIDWSYNLLDEQEKKLFSRLSVFQGGRTVEAVEAVCSQDLNINILDGLESLLNKSLIGKDESHEWEIRFIFLESIHEYAREQLEHMEGVNRLSRRHAEYFVSLAESAEPKLFMQEQVYWYSRLRAEKDNLRTAINWSYESGNVELGLRIISALREYWYTDGQFTEVLNWIKLGLKKAEKVPSSLHVKVLNTASYLAFGMGDYKQIYEKEAISIARKAGDVNDLAWSLVFRGGNLTANSDMHNEGVKNCMEALDLFYELNDKPGIAMAYNLLGEYSRLNGEYDTAVNHYEESMRISRESGNLHRIAVMLDALGMTAYVHGDYELAEKYVLQELAIYKELKIKYFLAMSLASLAGPTSANGNPERGAHLMSVSITHLEAMGGSFQPTDQSMIDLYLNEIKGQLDEATFHKAWEEGKSMTLEEALAYALGEE